MVAEKNETIGLAYKELQVISSDEGNRRLYEARLKQQRDIWSFEDAARMEGILKAAKAWKYNGGDVDIIAKSLGLTIDDILRL